MAFTRVAQSYLNLSGTSTTALDTTSALTLQAGDLLFFVGCFNSDAVATFADVDGGNVATMFARVGDGSSGYLRTGYFLSATAGTKNFRLSLSVASTYSWICVLQYRPGSGFVAELDAGPSPSAVTTSSTPQSGAITTSGAGVIIGSLSHGYLQTSSSPLIGGDTATLYPSSGSVFFGALDLITTAAKTSARASVSIDGWRTWVMDIAAFKEVSSGGGNVDVTPNSLATPSPTIGQTTLSQGHNVAPVGLSATPSVGTTSLTQNHALTASAITLSAPVVGSFALSQNHALAPASLATASPSLGNPTVTSSSTDKSVSPVSIATGSPSVGQTSITQNHVLSPANIATPSPVVGNPTLSSAAGNNSVTPSNISTPAPIIGTTVLRQNHSIAPLSLSTTPAVGALSLSQNHALGLASVLSGVPAIGHPTVSVQDPTQVKVNTLDLSFMVISDINAQLSAYNDVSFVMQSFSEVSV